MPTAPQQLEHARAIIAGAEAKLDALRQIEPFLLDVSLRENLVGSAVGQTLQDKLDMLPQLRAFGLRNISLGTLDYALPDELEVEDDFMRHLRDSGADMTGCFAFTALGIAAADGTFTPDSSQLKLRAYRVPNTVHEIYLSRRGMAGNYDLATLRRSLPASIRWLHDNIRGEGGGPPRILINIADGCDAFAESLESTCEILALLAGQPIEGVTIEDDRGTYLPFQVGAFVAVMRSLLPRPLKILVHLHAGGGFENASAIEALLNGADGLWAALPKRAAVIGHASLGELLANLARLGNAHVHDYRLDQLLPLATGLQQRDEQGPVPEDLPVLGSNAYRLSYSGFAQIEQRLMDLPPQAIGGRYGYRVCPAISDSPVLAGRLAEVTGQPVSCFPVALTERMIRLMRRDLRAGIRIVYDQPEHLLALLSRARALEPGDVAGAPTAASEPATASSRPKGRSMDDINDVLDSDGAVYKTLLESTQAIPWRIDWASSQFTYIGPQIENLLGWEPSSWVSVQDWATRMHPEDRRWAVDFCVAQSIAGVDHEADYRALTRDGNYVWIRDVVHVVRNADGSVDSLIGFMFDISERKRNEQQLIELQHELERLSFKDGLTGVGNRRHFETTLATEWNNAQREHKPLSLILLDIDFFKQYNDHYGHVAGDDCLRRIGTLLEPSAARPRDLVARYGGEEFVLVLPGADAAAAMHLAERCRATIADAAIAHARSTIAPVLTVSLGVGTMTPAQGDASRTFIEAVDRALYQAKQQGRNRVVASAGDAPAGAPSA